MRWALLLIWIGGAAHAGHICQFAFECFEGEACAETTYGFEVQNVAVPEGDDLAVRVPAILDETGQIPLPFAVDGPGKARSWAGVSEFGAHLLTLGNSGQARYTVHMAGSAMSILYVGTCEETP